jgi:hypothetical protein
MSLVSRLETLSVDTDVLRRERSFLEHLDPPASKTCDETRRSFWDIFSIADRHWSLGCCCTCENDVPSSIVPAPVSEEAVLENAGGILAVAQLKEGGLPSSSRTEARIHKSFSSFPPANAAESNESFIHANGEASEDPVRLQKVMAEFLRQSWKGCPCIYIEQRTGERHSARYFLDKQLSFFSISDAGTASATTAPPHIKCPIGIVGDVYTIDDGPEMFPEKVLTLCSHAERSLLLMVTLNANQISGPACICMLAENAAARDMFFDSMTVIASFSQSQSVSA